MRLCALVLFMLLAAAGIGLTGIAPTLSKDRKLFPDIEAESEKAGTENTDIPSHELFN